MKSYYYLFVIFISLPFLFRSEDKPLLSTHKVNWPLGYNWNNIIQKLLSYEGPKTFILSYPGSANTWVRYFLEYLTRRPSFERFGYRNHPMGFPIGISAKFLVDLNKPPFEKAHSPIDIKYAGGDSKNDILIFVIRNPKEVFVRNRPSKDILAITERGVFSHAIEAYFECLTLYHEWALDKKILIYYEDLILFPEREIRKLMCFLHEPIEPVKEFMAHYNDHKQKGLSIKEILSPNVTSGQQTFFYSKKLTYAERKKIDFAITKKYPLLWECYLKDRYEEQEEEINEAGN